MQREDFDDFFKTVINDFINELRIIDEDFHCLTVREHRFSKVFFYYELMRTNIRKYFMHLESKPMDRHKIGAVLLYAVLKSKILKVNKFVANLPDQLLMANEYLAINVALSVVELYKRDEEDCPYHDNYEIILPPTYHEKVSSNYSVYLNNLCKSLYYLNNLNNFDVFAYSNILFLLERYTDTLLES